MRTRFIPAIALLAALAIAPVLSAPDADARVYPEVRAGYYVDAESPFVGGGLVFPISGHWMGNPNLEYVFVDNATLFTVNADVHYDLNDHGSGPAFWLGGGLAIIFLEPEGFDSQTDAGLNLFGGLGAKNGSVRPFAQAKATLSDNSEFSIAAGLRF